MVWISVAWIAYEMYYKVTDQYNEHWQWDWITSDFWHILNLVFLCVLCFLFRPSPLSTRFSYTDSSGKLSFRSSSTKISPCLQQFLRAVQTSWNQSSAIGKSPLFLTRMHICP